MLVKCINMQIRAMRNDDASKPCDLNTTAFHGTGEKQSGSGQLQQDKGQGAMFLNLVQDTNRTYCIYIKSSVPPSVLCSCSGLTSSGLKKLRHQRLDAINQLSHRRSAWKWTQAHVFFCRIWLMFVIDCNRNPAGAKSQKGPTIMLPL